MRKHIFTIAVALVLLAGPVFACATAQCPDPNIKVTVSPLIAQGQQQGQSQGQLQGQLQGQQQGINAPLNNNASLAVTNPDNVKVLTAPAVTPLEIGVYQNGKVSNWNDWPEIPIQGMTYLKKGEVVVKVLKVINGFPGWRVRIEDVLSKIIANKIIGPNVRYFVQSKGAVTGGGINLLPAASGPIGNGMGTGATPMGYTESVQNPQHVIQIVEVEQENARSQR